MQHTYLIYLDRFRLGDVFFLQALGHALARLARAKRPAVVLHGPGEFVERVLESEGIFVDPGRVAALDVEAHRERSLLAMRELNHRLVSLFTESLAPAVGMRGADQRIFESADAGVVPGRLDVVHRQVALPSTPVIDASAVSAGGFRLVDPLACLDVFLSDERSAFRPVVFTRSNLPGIMTGGEVRPEVHVDDASVGPIVKDTELLELLTLRRADFLLTNAARLGASGKEEGTLVRTAG